MPPDSGENCQAAFQLQEELLVDAALEVFQGLLKPLT
jgi:hypothetical protein